MFGPRVGFLFMVPGTLAEPRPGLGRTEPVSHSTFSNHKRKVAQERPAGAEFCFVKMRYGRLGGSAH